MRKGVTSITLIGFGLLLAFPAKAVTIGPDAFGYVAADEDETGVDYLWVDTSAGTSLELADDEQTSAIPLGFSFEYYGVDYTDVYVLSNGALLFEELPIDPDDLYFMGTQCPLPSPGEVDGMIAFYHRDFNPSDSLCGAGCNLHYDRGGTAPDRWWALTFDRVPVCCNADPPDPVTVQVILYEGTNEIKVQVQDAGVYTGSDATIGIEAPDGIAGLNWPGCLMEGSTRDEMAIVFTPPTEGTPIVPPYQYAWDLPASTVDFEFFAFNLGTTTVTFDLAVTDSVWDTTVIGTSITVAPGGSDGFDVSVVIPSDAIGGESDEATITLTPDGGGDAIDVSTFTLVQDTPDDWQRVSEMPILVDSPVAVGLGTDLWLFSGIMYDAIAIQRYITPFVQVLHLGGEYLEWEFSAQCPENAAWDHDENCCADIGGNCVDPVEGTLAPMPDARGSLTGCGMDGIVYLVGGQAIDEEEGGYVADTIFIYDTLTNTWTEGAAMPEGRMQSAVVCDPERGKVFVIGGYTPFDEDGYAYPTTTLWAYDVDSDTWDEGLSQPDGTRVGHSAELIDDDTILVAGGFYDDYLSLRSDLYIIETDTWERTGDLPWERFLQGSAILPPGRMCLMGGTSFAGDAYNANDDSFDCYSEGYWIPQLANLSPGRTYVSGATLGDSIYVVGGVEVDPEDDPRAPTVYDQLGLVDRYPTSTLPDEPPVEPEPEEAPDEPAEEVLDEAPDMGPDVTPDVVPEVTPDVTPDVAPDAGPPPSEEEDDGCGCAAAGSHGQSRALLILGLFLGIAVLRRRQ